MVSQHFQIHLLYCSSDRNKKKSFHVFLILNSQHLHKLFLLTHTLNTYIHKTRILIEIRIIGQLLHLLEKYKNMDVREIELDKIVVHS